jgi:hypothetical protein
MTSLLKMECGWCANEKKPTDMLTGWAGWFICGDCAIDLAKIVARANPETREKLISDLIALRTQPAEGVA